MSPDFHPLEAGIDIPVERVAEGIRRRRVILLIEKGFGHSKFRQRVVFLLVEGLLILLDRVVIAPLLSKRFAPRDNRANPNLHVGFENVDMRIEDDAARLWPAENFGGEAGVGAADFDCFYFRISF